MPCITVANYILLISDNLSWFVALLCWTAFGFISLINGYSIFNSAPIQFQEPYHSAPQFVIRCHWQLRPVFNLLHVSVSPFPYNKSVSLLRSANQPKEYSEWLSTLHIQIHTTFDIFGSHSIAWSMLWLFAFFHRSEEKKRRTKQKKNSQKQKMLNNGNISSRQDSTYSITVLKYARMKSLTKTWIE